MLRVKDDRRSRSKSPGGRDRDRSHSRDTRQPSPRRSKKYSSSSSESEDDRRYREKKSGKKYYESESEDERYRHRSSKKHEDSDSDRHRRKSTSKKYYDSETKPEKKKSSKKGSKSDSGSEDISISIHRKSSSSHKEDERERKPGHVPAPAPPPPGYVYAPQGQYVGDPRVAYQNTRHLSYVENLDPRYGPPGALVPVHSDRPDHVRTHSISGGNGQRYAEVERYQYAQLDPNLVYVKAQDRHPDKQYIKTYNQNGEAHYTEVKPEADKKHDKHKERDKKYYEDKYGISADSVSSKMSLLTVGGAGVALVANRRSSNSGDRPPASPLLEAYRGTYQSISPMPTALVLSRHKNDSDLSDLDLSGSSDSDSADDIKKKIRKLEKEKQKHEKGREVEVAIMPISPAKKRVAFYDATADAKKIAAALQGTHHAPNTKPLVQILPGLSADNIVALRAEYKVHAKVGGQGINLAKHIKTRVPGHIGKVAYATALGRWESEAFWANSWYQGGASRRELLIESLMGRTNGDIREIKNCFKDKRYNDDLEKCMKAELKADKFRTAILLALEERRMSDTAALDIQMVKNDVQDLYRALVAKEGGESAMIQIIVLRSDVHLREVMRIFEKVYERNFARDMIAKSRNLVGETLAHILNGALNRPMRDALLLRQAISETAPGKERAELLISRVVRLHWEPKHLEKVKIEYERRYNMSVEMAIRKDVVEIVKGDEARLWGEFCIELVRNSSR